MSLRTWGLAIALGLFVPLGTSCLEVECGEGTIEDDGRCRSAEQSVSSAGCGEGTVLQAGRCVPVSPPTVCEEATTTTEVDPITGVTICVGYQVDTGCFPGFFACPQASVGKVTICGQLIDVAGDNNLEADGRRARSVIRASRHRAARVR